MVIYALLLSKCHELHLRAFGVKSTRVPGLGLGRGCQANLGNARILRAPRTEAPPLLVLYLCLKHYQWNFYDM